MIKFSTLDSVKKLLAIQSRFSLPTSMRAVISKQHTCFKSNSLFSSCSLARKSEMNKLFGIQRSSSRHSAGSLRTIYAREYQGWDGSGQGPSKFSLLIRPLIFSGIFVFGSISLAAILRDERNRRSKWSLFSKDHHDFWGWRLSTPQILLVSITTVNCIVFACWSWSLRGSRVFRDAHPWLRRNFLHYAFSGRALPLVCSVFSHVTFTHLAFNMIALWSLAPPVVALLGPENFLALYLSSGTLASLVGTCHKLVVGFTLPSVGASGALMFLASTTAFLWPSARFGLIFLPGVYFPASVLLGGLVCMDLAGVLLGWRMFDHAAHLGGVAAGWLLVRGGGWQAMHDWQTDVVRHWRAWRAGGGGGARR